MNEEIDYGPVIVTKGKYKGRIGCYDDDEDQYEIGRASCRERG